MRADLDSVASGSRAQRDILGLPKAALPSSVKERLLSKQVVVAVVKCPVFRMCCDNLAVGLKFCVDAGPKPG